MFMFLMSITKYTFSDSQPSSIFRIDDMEIIHGHSYVFDNKSAKNIAFEKIPFSFWHQMYKSIAAKQSLSYHSLNSIIF